MEEEVKIGEKERETLRIDAQRLREELSDLKVEAEILQDKVKKAENRHLSTISTDISIPESPTFENSPRSTASSPLISTPPDELALPPPRKGAPALTEPPSPPRSDTSANLPRTTPLRTPVPASQKKSRLPSSANHSITPKPRALNTSTNIRPAGLRAATQTRTPAPSKTTTATRATSHRIPPSTSLNHIRTLTAQMQRLEARVQNARSKLPAPTSTPPRASPRSVLGTNVPSTVTIRSRKRTAGSTTSSMTADETPTQTTNVGRTGKHAPRLSTSGISRLSFGPLPNRTSHYDPDSSSVSMSRPSSRASVSSSQFARPERPASRSELARPVSRASLGGAKTPLGMRPRSSLSGSMHGHSQSIGRIEFDEADEADEGPTPSRRGTYSRLDHGDGSGSAIPLPRRQSGNIPSSSRRSSVARPNADLGETY